MQLDLSNRISPARQQNQEEDLPYEIDIATELELASQNPLPQLEILQNSGSTLKVGRFRITQQEIQCAFPIDPRLQAVEDIEE